MPQEKRSGYSPEDDYILKKLKEVRETETILRMAVKNPHKVISRIPFDQLCYLSRKLTGIINEHRHLSDFDEIQMDRGICNRVEGII